MLTPEQLEQRKKGVTASEIAAVAGLSPWATAHEIWLEKCGLADPRPATLKTRIGDIMEDLTAQLYCEETGSKLERCGTLVHPEYPWLMATPDRLVVGRSRLLELKNVGWRLGHHWDTQAEDGIPDYVRAQVETQLAVTGREDAHVAGMIGGEEFAIWHILPNLDVRRFLIEHARRFWNDFVVPGVMPDVDGSEGARRMIETVYAKSRVEVYKADASTEAWIERYLASLALEKRVEQEKAEAVQQICRQMGEFEVIESRRLGRGFWRRAGKNKSRSFRFFPRPLTARDDAEKAAAATFPEPDPVLVLPLEALAPAPEDG